jgi:hypothetical protein
MKIKITENNSQAIQAALDAVNGKATAFTVHTFNTVDSVSRLIKKQFYRVEVPFVDRAGGMATFQPARPQAQSYKYSMWSTVITVQIGADGKTCYLTDVESAKVYPGQGERFDLRMTSKAHAAYVARCAKRFGIIEPEKTLIAA